MSAPADKRQFGKFHTSLNPFHHPAFINWADECKLSETTILEPFAGANSLIRHLDDAGLLGAYKSYDIHPEADDVEQRDTLTDFPEGYEVCVTNPPWLAKNSAKRRGLDYPDSDYDDLYKHALAMCLNKCEYVAALVPESFIRSPWGSLLTRMTDFISLDIDLFSDTDSPCALALFAPDEIDWVGGAARLWLGDEYVGTHSWLSFLRPKPLHDGCLVRFNDPEGQVGLYAIDNTKEPSIRFCPADELRDYEVKPSGRAITRIFVDGPIRTRAWNDNLNRYRTLCKDILLTSYRGRRSDGRYRRRCDWALAQGVIHTTEEAIQRTSFSGWDWGDYGRV